MDILATLITAFVFLFILSVLVLIHEAGHYFVAKKLGIKVEEFGFGLPPRLWGKKKGETIYSINWLPIGGFVKLYGEDEAGAGRIVPAKNEKGTAKDKDFHRSYISRPIWQRTAVVIAGVVMNTLLAIGIYYVFIVVSGFKTELPLIGNHNFFFVNQEKTAAVIIGVVAEKSPAAQAGIKPPARIIAVNTTEVVSSRQFADLIRDNKGKEIKVVWEDLSTQKRSTATVVPRVNPPKDEGSLGVAFVEQNVVNLSYDTPVQKAFSGIIHPMNLMVYNFSVLGTFIDISIKEKNVEQISQGVSGPVGIFSLVDQLIAIPDLKQRVLQLLNLAGLLSISLAFFNVLPIPGLDGGRLFFIIIEAIIGRKVNQKVEGYAHAVGMMLLIALILLITFKDIVQLFR